MCFSLLWLRDMFIWAVVIFAILALLRLLVSAFAGVSFWPLVSWPPTAGAPGAPTPNGFVGFLVAAINIMIWAFIACALIYFIFMLIGCLLSFTGGLPRLR